MDNSYDNIVKILQEVDKDIRVAIKQEIDNGSSRFRISCLLFAQSGINQATTSLDDLKVENNNDSR